MGNVAQDKLKELVLYIAEREKHSSRFGATKLNKILYFADFAWYLQSGFSMTGATYQKLDHGPAPRELLPVQQALLREGAAQIQVRRTPFNRKQKRLVPLRGPDLSCFTADQLSLVNEVIDWLEPVNAGQVSLLTHEHLGWRLADLHEDIPYFTALLCDDIAEPSDIDRGLELAAERGWLTQET